MNVDDIILDLCRRFGVSKEFGRRLRPLVSRAQKSPSDARKRIMALVERSFAQEANRTQAESACPLPPADRKLLGVVAGILHRWQPPKWLKYWGELYEIEPTDGEE